MDQSEHDRVIESSDSTVAVDEQPAAVTAVAAEAASTDGAPETTRGFLAELTHAMRGAAERERERITADVDAATEAHVEKVRARAATEAAELRRLAEDDIDGIHAWAKEETIRIQMETERRIGTRREELQSYLIRHATIIDGEVGHIEGAVREYRTQLDRFFEQLASETDPAAFARLADAMPDPPDLAKVGGAARAEAVAALAEEQDAANEGVADAVASVAAGGESGASMAFDPGQPGPELVPVMGEANGSTNTSVIASVVASGDPPKAEDASTEATGSAEGETATEHPNVAVRLLRTIASSLSAPAEPAAETTHAGGTAETTEPTAAAEGSAAADGRAQELIRSRPRAGQSGPRDRAPRAVPARVRAEPPHTEAPCAGCKRWSPSCQGGGKSR